MVNDPTSVARGLSDRAMAVLVAGAGITTASAIGFTLANRYLPICIGTLAVFVAYFGIRAWRWRSGDAGDRRWRALPLLAFWAPLPELLGSFVGGHEIGMVIGLKAFTWVFGFAILGHLLLEFVIRRKAAGYARFLTYFLVAWLGVTWLLSTGIQAFRFHYFLPSGNPEDTAYLFDCFRNWAAGGALESPWSAAWLHQDLKHHFGLHFSPILLPVFALARVWPSVTALLTLQNIFIGVGFVVWSRVLSRRWTPRTQAGGVPVSLWFLVLLVAFPPLNGALRHELHPVFWAMPVLAMVHGAFLTRRRHSFIVWGAAALLFREDLGMVLAAYAPMALLMGRRSRDDAFWWFVPLLGAVSTVVSLVVIMPRFGHPSSEFFRLAFDTSESSLVPFLLSLTGQPGEAAARLLRPAHWLVALQLAITGIGMPLRSWQWIPALPYLVLYGLVGRELQLLQLSSHYFVIPALYLVAGGLFTLWTWVHDLKPHVRDAVCILVWVLCLAQPIRLHLASPGQMGRLDAYRADVLADLALVPAGERAWVPTRILIGTNSKMAAPMHRWAIRSALTLDHPPEFALFPSGNPAVDSKWADLCAHYQMSRRAEGRVFDLYELSRRDSVVTR